MNIQFKTSKFSQKKKKEFENSKPLSDYKNPYYADDPTALPLSPHNLLAKILATLTSQMSQSNQNL